MSDKHATLENRDGFQSKWGFILACIGSAVGMGNIWRFPIMVQQFGGHDVPDPLLPVRTSDRFHRYH